MSVIVQLTRHPGFSRENLEALAEEVGDDVTLREIINLLPDPSRPSRSTAGREQSGRTYGGFASKIRLPKLA